MKVLAPILILAQLAVSSATAEMLVATRTIRSRSIIGPNDVAAIAGNAAGTFSKQNDIVGLESRVVLYQGRVIKKSDVGSAALVERNQIIALIFEKNGLSIATEARSLGRAGVGERLRVMNLGSRTTVSGIVQANGSVIVDGNSSTLSK